jgi:O-antigen/teichoic acid export membrane protein
MSVLKEYLSGSAAGIVGKATTALSGFGSLWLLNQILTKEGFGEYTTAFTIIGIFALVSQAGLRNATVQRVAELKAKEGRSANQHQGAVLAWVALLSIATSLILFGFSRPLSELFGTPELTSWIQLLSVVIPGLALVPVEGAIRKAHEEYIRAIALLQVFPQLFRVSGLYLVLQTSPSPEAVVGVIGVSHYLPLAGFLLHSNDWRYLNLTGISRNHWRFSGQLLLNSMASRLFQSLDILLVTALASATATGNYRIAWKIALIVGYADQILSTIIQPRMSTYLTNRDTAGLQDEFQKVRDASIIGGAAILIVIILLGRIILDAFGNYEQSYLLLVLLGAGQLLNRSFGNVHEVLMMGREGKLILYNSILGISLNLVGNLVLIPPLEEYGAAISTILTVFLTSNIVVIFLIRQSIGIDVFDSRTTGSVAVSVLLVVLAVQAIPTGEVFATIILSLLIGAVLFQNRGTLQRTGFS